MSAGGVFKLIANDGKPDRLLVATALLNQRIRDVMCRRSKLGKDPTPTLLDLEKTHILHINAHFKPFAALGYEYNKVRAASGTATLGSTVQFSIPQFGDFFHDMVGRCVLSECYQSTTEGPDANSTAQTATGPYSIKSVYPRDGYNWDDDDAIAGASYAVVDAFGNSVADGTDSKRNMIRYVEYPGERLFAKVQFEVNGNPLDEYDYRTASMMRKFCIHDEKLYGYKKMIGQEVAIEGMSGPRACPVEDAHYDTTLPASSDEHGPSAGPHAGSILNEGKTASTYMLKPVHSGGGFQPGQWESAPASLTQAGQTQTDLVVEPITGVTASDTRANYGHVSRQLLQAVDGPQTPKYWQPPLEIWNRLWFWFNLDARLSVPSVSIPVGQRFITITLATAEDILVSFPGLFIQQTINAADAVTADLNVDVTRNFRPWWNTTTLTAPTISTLELYINNIFVNPEVHDLFIRRVGFSLIRVFRQHVCSASSGASDLVLLSQLKWPIECLFIGFQPVFNYDKSNNKNYHRDWHRMGKTFDVICESRQSALTGADGSDLSFSNIGQIIPDTYVVERPTVTDISISAHGIKIHDAFPQAFFNSYEPFHYGDTSIRPPKDAGAMMVNFSLFTGCYQPSGYLNTSRAREFYLHWTSNYISTTTTVCIIAVGIALNFLLVTDGSAVLRYST